ncbi:MMPL family transporter, partial [Pantoea sp. SIMBA_133]
LEEAGAGDETISVVFTYDQPVEDKAQQTVSSIAEKLEGEASLIKNVLDPFESEELTEQLVSENKQTVLLPITVDGTDEEVNDLANRIRE